MVFQLYLVNKSELETYLVSKYPKEACAVLVKDCYYAIRNISTTPIDSFVLDPVQLSKVLDIGKLEVIIHSHCDTSCTPSDIDIESMQDSVDWWIYSIIKGNINEIWKKV